METLYEIIKRFKELSLYNPQKGILREWGEVDASNYVCVGEVNYWPWSGNGKLYVMVSPQKIVKWDEEIYNIVYTQNPDGTGLQDNDIPAYYKRFIEIYPEHQDDEYGEIFLGKRKNKEVVEQQHKNFMSKLFKIDGNIVIHHNSSFVIKDGFVKKGNPNGWSNNTDIGIYFWGSRNAGNDPSNATSYSYYCLIPQEELYDFQTNVDRLTLDQVLKKYKYAGQFWKNSDSIVVSTLQPTPIWCILDKDNGKWYDKNWQEIEKPF